MNSRRLIGSFTAATETRARGQRPSRHHTRISLRSGLEASHKRGIEIAPIIPSNCGARLRAAPRAAQDKGKEPAGDPQGPSGGTPMASVAIRDLRKAFGATEVIHGVDVLIGDGEFVVLVGPSGCGKSPLL